MDYLEKVSEGHKGLYVDLFVRPSNEIAIQMYRNLGYDVYQTVDKYYSGGTKNKDGTVGVLTSLLVVIVVRVLQA